jgi:tRNA-specific 2-thiouridylase
MSVGVDSSVAAAVLLGEGLDVTGVTLALTGNGPGCCGREGADLAARAAARLGVRHYVWDMTEEFAAEVIEPFCSGYAEGRTPNPCLDCNGRIKFEMMLARVRELGFEALATGHFARVETAGPPGDGPDAGADAGPDGAAAGAGARFRLLKGRDEAKDQSYALYMLSQGQLAHIRFPLGDMTKDEVRAAARRLDLPTAGAPESQDICFVPDGDAASFVAARRAQVPPAGDIVDTAGRVLGRHPGIHGFTIGQRRGLGIAEGERRYVVRLEPSAARVVVGDACELMVGRVPFGRARWVGGTPPPPEMAVDVMLRYRGPSTAGRVRVDGASGEVVLAEPATRPAPGQAVVFYSGDEVLGGGIVS